MHLHVCLTKLDFKMYWQVVYTKSSTVTVTRSNLKPHLFKNISTTNSSKCLVYFLMPVINYPLSRTHCITRFVWLKWCFPLTIFSFNVFRIVFFQRDFPIYFYAFLSYRSGNKKHLVLMDFRSNFSDYENFYHKINASICRPRFYDPVCETLPLIKRL